MDLSAFYGAFSPACFALLGLWLVAVQVRLPVWEKDPERRRRSHGVALHFALPGMMSMFALIDVQTPVFWRVSFGIIAPCGSSRKPGPTRRRTAVTPTTGSCRWTATT